MLALVAIAALIICFVVIFFVVRIYKESPKIKKNIEQEDL
jgi:uncharacterized protein YoxC